MLLKFEKDEQKRPHWLPTSITIQFNFFFHILLWSRKRTVQDIVYFRIDSIYVLRSARLDPDSGEGVSNGKNRCVLPFVIVWI